MDPRSLEIQVRRVLRRQHHRRQRHRRQHNLRRRRHRVSQPGKKTNKLGNEYDEQESVVGVVSSCHDFWNRAPDDVLLEIFIRLPDCRSAVRSSTVCQLWHSLILGNPRFIPRFKSQRQEGHYPPLVPYTSILFSTTVYGGSNLLHPKRNYQVFSKEWMFLHELKLSASHDRVNYVDFLPEQMVIRASCNGLLLLCRGGTDDQYICNPITKQLVQLPPIPELDVASDGHERHGYGLVCTPTNTQFKVVRIIPPARGRDPFVQDRNATAHVTIFCSESRKWESRRFRFLRHRASRNNSVSDIVTSNGSFCWLDGLSVSYWQAAMCFYLDLLKEQCGVIDFPYYDSWNPVKHRIGAVRVGDGELELRLIQMSPVCLPGSIHLTVWRLKNNNNNKSVLVHSKLLKRPKNLGKLRSVDERIRDKEIPSQFVHPTNGDSVIILWCRKFFEYNLIDATYKLIDDLPETRNDPSPMFLPHCASNFDF